MVYPENAAQCTARSKSTGVRCENPAVVGLTVCRVHGGSTKKAKSRSAIAKAERTMLAYSKPLDASDPLADPMMGLQHEYLVLQSRLQWLRKKIDKLTQEEALWGKTREERIGASETPGKNVEYSERIHPWMVLEQETSKRLVQVEKLLADLGYQANLDHQTKMQVERYLMWRTAELMRAVKRDPSDPRVFRAVARVFGGENRAKAALSQRKEDPR